MNLTWQLTALIASVLAFLAFIIFLEYRQSKRRDPKKPPNVYVITAVFNIVILFTVFLLEGLEVIPEGWAKDHWYLFIILLIGTFILFLKTLPRLKALPIPKLVDKAWSVCWDMLRARPAVGSTFNPPIPNFKIIQTKEDVFDKVILFDLRTDRGQVLLALDITDGYPVEYLHKPSELLVTKRFGKEVAQHFDLEREIVKNQYLLPEEDDEED